MNAHSSGPRFATSDFRPRIQVIDTTGFSGQPQPEPVDIRVIEGQTSFTEGPEFLSRATMIAATITGGASPRETEQADVTSGEAKTSYQVSDSHRVAIRDADEEKSLIPWFRENENGEGILMVENFSPSGKVSLAVSVGDISKSDPEVLGQDGLLAKLFNEEVHEVSVSKQEGQCKVSIWGMRGENFLTVADGKVEISSLMGM